MAAKKKTTSTGSPTLDAANAAKKFKAPKGYKPLTTAQKAALAASLTPVGRAAGAAGKAMQLRKDMKYLFGKETIKAGKANKRALKAAQATPSKRNAGVAYSKDAIKNAAPARPNRVRGGSIKSKQNWPEGMKKPKPSLADPKVAEAKRKADAAARLKRIDYNSRNGIF